jgi:hypothetical protein
MLRPLVRYRITVTLDHLAPPIWRRLVVSPAVTLRRFHHIVQAAMGWATCHRYRFQQDGREFGRPDPAGEYLEDDLRFTLKYLLMKPGDSVKYEYDFRDSWLHTVLLEQVIVGTGAPAQARCIDGARACPPEDCGGVQGYLCLLEVIHNPFHARHREMLAWVGRDFDPQAFDTEAVNRLLAPRKTPRRNPSRPNLRAN